MTAFKVLLCAAIAVAALANTRSARTGTDSQTLDEDGLTADTFIRDVAAESSGGKKESISKYLNREMSWLAFNERVLAEADSPRHPLLEKVRFLSISFSNLDEFYMVRVAGLAGLARAGVGAKSVDELTPKQQLERISKACEELTAHQQTVWRKLKQELHDTAGIEIVTPSDLDEEDKEYLHELFLSEMWPQLTPQTIDPAHPFPFVANRGMGLVWNLQSSANRDSSHELMKQGRWAMSGKNDDKASPPNDMNAIMLIPPSMPRFMRLPSADTLDNHIPAHDKANKASAAQVRPSDIKDPIRFILIEDVIAMHMDYFFPDFVVKEQGMFRILRDSEVEVDEEAVDLVRMHETALKRRRKGVVVGLSVDALMPSHLLNFMCGKLSVEVDSVSVLDGLVGLADVKQVIVDDRKEFQFPTYKPRFPERISQFGGDIFEAIKAKDLVVHHPFETFDVVLQFLRQASRDPDVISIKQTLYRTSHDSPIVKELIEAAESGKTVTALIELKARFDEEANIRWARDMERAGVQVVYGFVELKTHAKVALVMRREADGLRPYVHLGTGNYHPYTAKIYTDLSLFTADPALCRDANRLFNFMTSLRKPYDLEKLAVAPVNLRTALDAHIRQEIANARAGFPAAIWAKMNSLVDFNIINLLYKASEAGVNITLIVRGMCALRPGVPGLSSRIVVKSIIGRFLEHSRVVAFANKQPLPSPDAKVFLSSADWMTRNLDWRVEALVPVENPTVHEQILSQIMLKNVEDVTNSWLLGSDGLYSRVGDNVPKAAWGGDAHLYFITHESLSGRGRRDGEENDDGLFDDTQHHNVGADGHARHAMKRHNKIERDDDI